ncbi:MAG TPA: hypothetical protein VGK16_02255 [Candidatus Limnocylindrales bacterium]|jgi:hypothetical protein
MDRFSDDQVDRALGAWLREQSATRAPARIVEDVFARTSRTRQARRWWALRPLGRGLDGLPGSDVRRPSTWQRASAFAGAIGILVVVVGLAFVLRPGVTGPGTLVRPSPSPSLSASPSATASASPFVRPSPTPVPTVLGSTAARRLGLGDNAGPIEVTEAFGSIWVADIHGNDVRRYDPATMREVARIPARGAAWFAVADGALWVTNQMSVGLTRIDPATNTVVARVGDVPPCGAPVVAFDSIWQSACDAGVFLRIDPATNTVAETIPAAGHLFLALAGGQLVTTGPEGLATLDPDTGAFTPIVSAAPTDPAIVTSDGNAVWVVNASAVVGINPADGRTVGRLDAAEPQAISFAGDRAWVTLRHGGVLEVDRATMKVTRTIPVPGYPLVPLESAGVLWVTDFESSALWRIEP